MAVFTQDGPQILINESRRTTKGVVRNIQEAADR